MTEPAIALLFVTRHYVARRALIDTLSARVMHLTADRWLEVALQHPDAERVFMEKAERCAAIGAKLRAHSSTHIDIAIHGIAPELVPALPADFGSG